MRQRRGIPRVALVAWLALIVGVAIWTERRLGDRSDAVPPAPVAAAVPAAPPRPRRLAPRPASLPVAAPPRLRLEGHVIDSDGRDVAGAIVTFEPELDGYGPFDAACRADRAAAVRITTDAAGRFAFEPTAPHPYRIIAVAGPLVAGPVRYTARDTARPLVIRLQAGASATVTVSDEAGTAIPDARIKTVSGVCLDDTDTDARGRATLGPLPPGWIGITVEAAGHAAGFLPVGFDRPGAHHDLAITLYRGLAVSGRIVDEHHHSIARARIDVTDRRNAFMARQIASDDRGEFALPALVRGMYTVDVTAEGYLPVRTTVAVDRTAVRGFEIVMTSGASITGVVVDADHRAVPFATVSMWGQRGAIQTTSDAGGNFELRGVATGSVSISAEAPAGQHGSAGVRIAAPTDAPDIEIVVYGDGVIAGTVVDDHGAALAGIAVRVSPDRSHPSNGASKGSRYGHAITDEAGGFVITGLADASYLVSPMPRDMQPVRWPPPGSAVARAGDRDVRLTLSTGGRLTGHLVDQTGLPVDAAWVAVSSPGVSSAGDTTGRDGTFDIRDAPPGRYDLMSFIRGVSIAVRKDVEIRGGETTDLGTLTVARPPLGRSLTGRVVDPTGAPIGNATVELGVLRPPPVDEDDPPAGFHAYLTAFTAPDGSFRMLDIFPTPMLARATDFAYGPSATLAIPTAAISPGDPPPITLVLSPRDAR